MMITNLRRVMHRKGTVAFTALALLLAGGPAMSLESPDYTVVHRDGPIEYRQYAPYLVAETVIEDARSHSAAGNEGFRRLFRYITGANRSQAKIAMTAPVAQGAVDSSPPAGEKIAMTAPVEQSPAAQGWRVAFMVPSDYDLATAPVPTDPRVQVREVPGRLVAALTWSGRWTDANFEAWRAELEVALADAGVEPAGPVQAAMYNGPFTPPFLRRNEVLVEVSAVPAAVAAL
jgi:hypothetical protein